MLQAIFHAWEHRLASVTTDRVVRPFEWGLDWIPQNGRTPGDPQAEGSAPSAVLSGWVSRVMADTDAFFSAPPTDEYLLSAEADGDLLTFPSALVTPHETNNTVYCRYFPATVRLKPDATTGATRKAAVLVLPQWNADVGGHAGLCRLLAWSGLSALRLSLPYHDQRMPPELHRADYIVSANIARTLQICRQAVLDARRAIAWLASQGYTRIGILGTSLGSCLSLLTTAHEPLIKAQALNHISPHFADVVWRGLSTRHVRDGLDGHIDLDFLRALWRPISPRWYLERLRDRRTLLVYARYDLTFPVDLSRDLVHAFAELNVPHEVAVLPCGHYSSGKAPFKFLDGWILTRFLKKQLTAM
ncbi:MAG: abhydrolase domain-containing 18 [Acidobacteria bacterium]|nr:abhydrolase domain-containing 18 [Acidobacteriota bacterium]